MSYSRAYRNHAAFLADNPDTPVYPGNEQPADHRDAAVKGVEAILATGALSRQSACDHKIYVSGHHTTTKGLGEYLQISISQIDVLPPKVKEAQADGETDG